MIIILLSTIIINNYVKIIGLSIILGLILGCFSTVIAVIISTIHDNKYIYKLKLNTTGKAELKKWFKFEKFIKDYTLIKEKIFQDIVLYEQFIPYAVAIGVNKNYKDTLFNVFN